MKERKKERKKEENKERRKKKEPTDIKKNYAKKV